MIRIRVSPPSLLPLTSAMSSLKEALLSALKSLLRGRPFLQALFAVWMSPTTLKGTLVDAKTALPLRTVDEFLREAEKQLVGPIEGNQLHIFSTNLKRQFRERLRSHNESMLPSFNHMLPSGKEVGHYVALDVGGSTLRVALVSLKGRDARGNENEIVRLDTFKITPEIRKLEGMCFFDWMATRISEVIRGDGDGEGMVMGPIPMGLAWSFPVEYVLLELLQMSTSH